METIPENTKPESGWMDRLVRHSSPIPHIRWSNIKQEMPPELLEKLEQWMTGHEMLCLDDGDSGVFTRDFDHWAADYVDLNKFVNRSIDLAGEVARLKGLIGAGM